MATRVAEAVPPAVVKPVVQLGVRSGILRRLRPGNLMVSARHSRRQLDEEIEDAIEVNAQQRATEDFREGVKAFLERRHADWPSMKARG